MKVRIRHKTNKLKQGKYILLASNTNVVFVEPQTQMETVPCLVKSVLFGSKMSWHLNTNIWFCLRNPTCGLSPVTSSFNASSVLTSVYWGWFKYQLIHLKFTFIISPHCIKVDTVHTKLAHKQKYLHFTEISLFAFYTFSSSDIDTWCRHLANVLYSPFSYMWEFRETSGSLAAKLFTIFTSQSLRVPACCLLLMCLYMTVWEHGREPQERNWQNHINDLCRFFTTSNLFPWQEAAGPTAVIDYIYWHYRCKNECNN